MIHRSSPKPTAATTKSQIRGTAVLGAFFLLCASSSVGLYLGKSLSQAVSNGAAATIGGLTGWTVYHLVSRRNDGLGFLGASTFPVSADSDIPFLPAVGISLVILIPLAWLIGLTTRGIKMGGGISQSNDLLYDADVDEIAKPSAQ